MVENKSSRNKNNFLFSLLPISVFIKCHIRVARAEANLKYRLSFFIGHYYSFNIRKKISKTLSLACHELDNLESKLPVVPAL